MTPPSLLPPPGVTSNFINPSTRGPALVITSAVCIILMFICVTIRFYTKFYIRKTWGWDDCLCWPRPALMALTILGTCIPATVGQLYLIWKSSWWSLTRSAPLGSLLHRCRVSKSFSWAMVPFADPLIALGDGVGPHQWNVPSTAFDPDLLRVKSPKSIVTNSIQLIFVA